MLIRDRDSKFETVSDRVAHGAAVRVVVTPVKTPNMSAVCERFIGSACRECLNHVLLLGEKHMKSILMDFLFSVGFTTIAELPRDGPNQLNPRRSAKVASTSSSLTESRCSELHGQ